MGCCCSSKNVKEAEKQGLNAKTPAPNRAEVANTIGKSAGSACSKDILQKKIEQAAKTRVLALRECGLKSLPENATKEGSLTDLRTADLAINRMTLLPPSIQVWNQLQSLNASDNLLEQLPPTLAALVHLKKLILSKNRLSMLPERLAEMNITELKVDGNMLLGLPDAFGGNLAASLEELDVSGNRIQFLPDSIGHLRMITRIVADRNKLVQLPLQSRSAGGLARLQYVNAADNSISTVIPETLKLTALSELWLKGNPMDRLVLQQVDGFEEFAERRKQRLDQKIDQKVVGDVDLAMCGL